MSFPATHSDAPEVDAHVRAKCIWVFRIRPVQVGGVSGADASLRQVQERKKTTLEVYTQLDFKTGDPEREYEQLRRPLTVRPVLHAFASGRDADCTSAGASLARRR